MNMRPTNYIALAVKHSYEAKTIILKILITYNSKNKGIVILLQQIEGLKVLLGL